MSVYAITNKVGDPSQMAIVGPSGRLDFPAADGPLLASMLDSEFPTCVTGCGTREGVCGDCGYCPDCGACESCVVEPEDYDEDDEEGDDDVQHPWDDEEERHG